MSQIDQLLKDAPAHQSASPPAKPGRKQESEIDALLEEAAGKRSAGQAVKDVGLGLAQGAAGLVKSAGDAYGLVSGDMDNAVSKTAGGWQESLDKEKSAGFQARAARRKENIDAQDSTLGKAWTAVKDTVTDSALALDTVATNVSTLIPGAVAGRAVAAARMAQAARAGLTGEAAAAAATQAGKAGTAAALGTGAAQQATDVSAQAYEDNTKKDEAIWDANPEFQAALAANGGDREKAKHGLSLDAARAAFLPAAGISLAANAVPGGAMLEKALVGGAAREVAKEGAKLAIPKAIAKTALGEATGEAIEEGGGQYAANVAAQRYIDPNQDLMNGVGENAGLGAAGGLLMGAAGGAFHGHRPAAGSQQDQRNALDAANQAAADALEGSPSVLEAQQWSTAPGAAPDGAPDQTQAASPLYDPRIDGMSTSAGAAQAQGNEVDFTRDFDTAGLALSPDAPAGAPAAPGPDAAADLAQVLDQRTPAQRMGLDENAGTMSAAAVLAVNSGASGQLQAASAAVASQQQDAKAQDPTAKTTSAAPAPAPAVDADGHSYDDARMPELAPEEFTARQRLLNQELSVAMRNNDRPALSRIGDAKRELFNGSRSTADLMADYNAAEGSREATAKHEQRGIRDELGKRGLVVERQVQNDSGEVRFTAKPITQNTQQAPEPGVYATYEDARKARGEQNARGTSVKVIPSPVEGGFILAAKGTPEYAIGEKYAEQRRKQDSAANRQRMAESNAKYKAAADLAKQLKAEREGAQSAQAAAAPTINSVQTTGETANGIEANQAQQADPQRIAPVGDGGSIATENAGSGARAPRIVAKGRAAARPVDGAGSGQPVQGLTDGSTTTANPGAKAAPAPSPQAQAQEPAQQRVQRLDDAGAAWTRMPAAERQGIAARLDGVKPVIAKNLASSQWKNLNGDLQGKIADAIAPADVSAPDTTLAQEPAGAPSGPAQPDAQADAASVAAPAIESAAVSSAAHEAATSQQNDLAAPTEAQIEAGNYKKGHVRINGLDISIENPAGSKRRPEWPALRNHYGYFKGTVGADKDHVDVFLTDRASDPNLPVFVVDQVNRNGTFDEHKVVMGAANEADARQAYLDNYAKGWTGLGAITEMTQDDFKAWARDPAKTKVPAGKLPDAAPQAAKAPVKKPSRGVLAKMAETQAARADYFTPGNIVKSYIGHDRVISYSPPDADGRWSVKVQAVEKKDDAWVDMPNERVRSHFTQPSARDLADGPVLRAEPAPAVPTTEPAQAQSLLDRHTAIGEGTLALADYQQTFDALTSDKAAVVAELSKLTKDDLLRAGGAMFAYRYKGDKKDVIVSAAYETMLHTYALGRQYGSNTWVMSAEGRRTHEVAQAAALRELVGNTTAEDLAAHAAVVKAARDEFKARREAAASALENPKSLQDFRGFMRHWIEAGDTADQAFLRLSTEQRQAYDALDAESTREEREKAKADARKANVRSAGETTAGEIIETKHTKHGHDLFVVQLADRVSREDYDTLNTSARGLGGTYSSFRGNGAVPGFQFRSRESAQAFQQLVAGDTAAAQSVAQARRDAFEDDMSQTAVERLRTMAEAIDAEADAQLSADRKTNTARRARMAGAAEEAARGSKAYAGTMRNLAKAIEAGQAPFLDGVRTKTQLTQLQQAIGAAKANQLFAKHGSWAAAEEHKHSPADAQTVDFAEFPRFSMYRSDLAGLARQLLETDGGKKLGASLAKVADDVTAAYTDWAKANLQQVSQFGAGGQVADFANKADAERAIKRSGLVGKAVVLAVKRGQNRVVLSPGEAMQRGLWQGDGDKRINLSMDFVQDLVKLGKRRGNSSMAIPWQLESTLEKRQRLQRMGIQTPAEYRSALRELVNLREDAAAPDRVKELERSMVGRQNDGLDFFPTPSAVTENAVEAADIQPGMEVLEPSADMGHIADYIREQSGVEPDVVELSGKRRELLEAKGYDLVGFDFLDVNSKQYDRIVMNPPFSDGRDIQHVQHAYSLLKPGGRLVAIMGEGAFFQSNKRAEAFRDWLGSVNATNEKLPEGSFMDPSLPVNTGVSARMVVVDKPAGVSEPADVNFGREREASAVGTTTDRALMDMVREGKPAQDLLQLIAGTSKSRFNKQVARLLTKAKVSPTVVLEDGALGGDGNFTFLARYRRSSDTIGLTAGAQAQAEQILLHEMIHAATLKALDRKGVASLQMRKLYEHVKKQGGANGTYGMKNVGEFVAEAFTNPEFQRQLKQMSAPQGNVLKSAWDSLVRILHTILGLPVDSTNALSQALTLGVEVMRENVALRRRQAAAAGAGPDVAHFGTAELKEIQNRSMAYVHDAMNQAPGTVHWWHKTVGTMNNLAERNPAFKPVFDAAQQFTDDVSSLANDVANLAPRLIPRLESLGDLKFWGKDARKPISGEDNTAIAKPLFEGTLMWTRDIHGKPVTVDALEKETDTWDTSTKEHYLIATKELSAAQARAWQGLPLAQYEKLVTEAFKSKVLKPGIRWTDAELRSMFKLTDGQLSLFKEARSTIDASIDTTARADMMRMIGEEYRDMREAVMEAPTLDDALTLVTRTLQDEAKANPDSSDRLMALHNSVVAGATKARDLIAKGYAPLSRFGSHTVDVLDAKGERLYFGLFETAREADAMQVNMAEVYKGEPGVQIGRGTLSKEEYKLFAGVTPESLEAFGTMLGLDSEGNEAKDAAFQEYIRRTKNNHSALKRLIHRKGIAGYSQDVGRVLASFVYSNARQGAGALNAGTMEKAIQEIPKQQGQLRDVAMGLRSYIQDPQEEGQAVRGFLFAQYLGGSVASAVVNMLQPVQITFPWLSQYGGVKQAGAQLTRAFKDMATVGKTYEPDLAKALKRAEDEGTVSPQEIHQLMAQARGEASLRAGDGTALGNARATASNAWRRTVVAWGQPFAWAEQLNRRSTFIAAYRIAVAEKMADPDAFAAKAVRETQFQYSKSNKMRWGRGAIGGTLMTFKSYSVSYLELMGRMWNAGTPGSPQRAESRKALVLMVAMLALMGGAGGLPFVEDVEDLVNGLMNKMGYNWDSKQARKQFLQQVLGQAGAEFINSGISGLPGMPIDVAGRLGMGNLIPGTGLVGPQTDKSRDLLELVGPAGDFAKRIFNAAGMALGGSVGSAALEASPGAVRNAVKGVDMATSGMYKDGRGYKVIDTNLGEALSKFIGFQPRAVADVQEANGAMQKSRAFYTQQSAEIKAQWADALFRKDEGALASVRERLASWNRKNPDMPIVVQMPQIWKKVREMGKDKQQRIADTAPKALRQQMREMAREAGAAPV